MIYIHVAYYAYTITLTAWAILFARWLRLPRKVQMLAGVAVCWGWWCV